MSRRSPCRWATPARGCPCRSRWRQNLSPRARCSAWRTPTSALPPGTSGTPIWTARSRAPRRRHESDARPGEVARGDREPRDSRRGPRQRDDKDRVALRNDGRDRGRARRGDGPGGAGPSGLSAGRLLTTLRVLSAGAAQTVVERVAEDYRRATGVQVEGEFSAVGAIRQRVLDGAPVDVIVLTAAMIDELVISRHVSPGTRADLGKVGTGVAVRSGAPVPDVASAEALRAHLEAATRVVCPDPATATAGKVVLQVLERLGLGGTVGPRMQYFPNGYAAMKWLAESRGAGEIGIT